MMTGEKVVNIELTEADAAAFREFIKVREVVEIMSNAGIFALKNGKAVLNFNGNGVLEGIEVRQSAYKRGKSMFPQ